MSEINFGPTKNVGSKNNFAPKKFFKSLCGGGWLVVCNEKVKYQSNKCNYQATTNNNLAEHYRGVHEGVKYHCGQCDKKFSQREHQRAHAGVKYICQ